MDEFVERYLENFKAGVKEKTIMDIPQHLSCDFCPYDEECSKNGSICYDTLSRYVKE